LRVILGLQFRRRLRKVPSFPNSTKIAIIIIMKINLLFSLPLMLAGSLLAAKADPQADVTSAAAALGSQKNYSWTTTVEVGNNGGFKPGPTEGKTEKDRFTTLSLSFGDTTTDVVIKGTNAALKTPDNGWQSATEALADNGGGFNPAMFIARTAQNFKAPAAEAASLAAQAQALTAGMNGIAGDLTADGAKALLAFRRSGNGDAPTVANPKGSVTFWLADGKLVKYQFHVTGTVRFNGNDRDVDRTTTTQIKDVNTTTIDVPDAAKKKLE
jgi:hypothetical protein